MKTLPLILSVAVAAFAQTLPESGPLDDGAVAGAIRAANEAEIAAGKLAARKAQSREVKRFAKMMVEDHRKNDEKLTAAVRQAGVEPRDSAAAFALKSDSERHSAALAGQKGESFDKTYIEQQIAAHKKVLETIDRALAGGTRRDPAIADYLKSTRDAVARHLEHAENLRGRDEQPKGEEPGGGR